MYERGGKRTQIFLEYLDSLPENKVSIEFATFFGIVKLLMIRGESKSGLYTYYIKFDHGNNVLDYMLDRIVKMDLNGIYSVDMIGFRKSLNKSWHNHYELLT